MGTVPYQVLHCLGTIFFEPQTIWATRPFRRDPFHVSHKIPLLEDNVVATVLVELKHGAAYNLTVDLDIHAIGAKSERTRAQVVCVLTAVDPEV